MKHRSAGIPGSFWFFRIVWFIPLVLLLHRATRSVTVDSIVSESISATPWVVRKGVFRVASLMSRLRGLCDSNRRSTPRRDADEDEVIAKAVVRHLNERSSNPPGGVAKILERIREADEPSSLECDQTPDREYAPAVGRFTGMLLA